MDAIGIVTTEKRYFKKEEMMALIKKFQMEEREEKLADGVHVITVYISGYLDSTTFTELQDRLEELITAENIYLMINMKGLEYISMAGLGVIMGNFLPVRKKGGDFVLCETPQKIKDLFDAFNFSRMIYLFDFEEEGIEHLKEIHRQQQEKADEI